MDWRFFVILIALWNHLGNCQVNHYEETSYPNYDEEYSGNDLYYLSGDYNYSYGYDGEDFLYPSEEFGSGLHSYYEEDVIDESVLDYVPEMISRPLSLEATVGGRLELPCSAKNSSEFVRIWMHGTEMLFTGTVAIVRSDRFFLKDGEKSTLVIEPVTLEDAGKFTCRIMLKDEIILTHDVTVVQPFEVKPVPPTGLVHVKEGKQAVLKCETIGGSEGPSEFQWHRDGGLVMANQTGDELRVEAVAPDDAGKYYCSSESDKGDRSMASIQLKVLFAPKVTTMRKSVLRSGSGHKLEVTCEVAAEPKVTVSWYKEEQMLETNGRIRQENAGSKHLLIVDPVSSQDIGSIMCYAVNEVGMAQRVIQVTQEDISGKPQETESSDQTVPSSSSSQDTSGVTNDKVSTELRVNLNRTREEIDILRKEIERIKNSSARGAAEESSLELAVFSDLEHIQLGLTRLRETHEREVEELMDFKRDALDDMQRLWDNVNELQELSNTTAHHLDMIYGKDIVKLQNFQRKSESTLDKLSHQMGDLMDRSSQALQSSTITSSSKNSGEMVESLGILEDELASYRSDLKENQIVQTRLMENLQVVFEEIDTLKLHKQNTSRELLMMSREINQLEDGPLADLASKFQMLEHKVTDLDHFKEQANEKLGAVSSYDEDKFNLVIKELQMLKSQIYYLQQSVIQMRQQSSGMSKNDTESESSPDSSRKTSQSDQAQVKALSKDIETLQEDIEALSTSCVHHKTFDVLLEEIEKREDELIQRIQSNSRQIMEYQNNTGPVKSDVISFDERLKNLYERLNKIEADSMKYNLIIRGLVPTRRLERPVHLDRLVQGFFEEILNLNDVSYDEAERMKEVRGYPKPIRVRFPSIREKVKVLSRSRSLLRGRNQQEQKDIFVEEEFTPRVEKHRRILAAFARQRARIAKKKWALKYDELYFNGKIFVYDEELDRVVSKRNLN